VGVIGTQLGRGVVHHEIRPSKEQSVPRSGHELALQNIRFSLEQDESVVDRLRIIAAREELGAKILAIHPASERQLAKRASQFARHVSTGVDGKVDGAGSR
jgi:head-tail adaptor